jgi:hypothetical protein
MRTSILLQVTSKDRHGAQNRNLQFRDPDPAVVRALIGAGKVGEQRLQSGKVGCNVELPHQTKIINDRLAAHHGVPRQTVFVVRRNRGHAVEDGSRDAGAGSTAELPHSRSRGSLDHRDLRPVAGLHPREDRAPRPHHQLGKEEHSA